MWKQRQLSHKTSATYTKGFLLDHMKEEIKVELEYPSDGDGGHSQYCIHCCMVLWRYGVRLAIIDRRFDPQSVHFHVHNIGQPSLASLWGH